MSGVLVRGKRGLSLFSRCSHVLGLIVLTAFAQGAWAATCTSLSAGSWNLVGRWSCGHVPVAADTVVIAHNITLDANRTVAGLTVNVGATLSGNNRNLTVSGPVLINGSYNTGGGDLTTTSGGALTVNAGGTFSFNNGNAAINGNVAINGTLTSGGDNIQMTGANTTLSGTGNVVDTTIEIDASGVSVPAGASLVFDANSEIDVAANVSPASLTVNGTIDGTAQGAGDRIIRVSTGGSLTVGSAGVINAPNSRLEVRNGAAATNNGAITIGELRGRTGAPAPVFTQGVDSTLNIRIAVCIAANPCTFNASAAGNTVNYNGAAQTVYLPSGSAYSNLTLSGSGAKAMPTGMTVAGNFTMSGTAAATAPSALAVGGDFSIGAGNTFSPGTGTVTLNGAAIQTIGGGTADLSLFNLTVNNPAGIRLARNVVVTGTLSGTVMLTSTCPTDYTLTSNGGATIAHSCPPTSVVSSINCSVACTASNFSTVSWTVTFSASVTGVDASAFALVASGLTGTSITGVSGSGTTWTVSAYSGVGSGTLGLNQTGPGSVSPTLSGTFTGQVYAISAPPLLAEYRMDEAFWNGTANEVVDVSGNGNNAQAFNGASTIGTTPAIPGNPGTCNYGVFDNGGSITQGYVQTPLPNLTSDFTVTAWIRTTNNAIAGQRILIDDQNNSGGYGISLGDPGAGRVRFYSRGITPVSLDSSYAIASNTWYFIAAVADITNKQRTIYVFDAAGSLLNSTTEAAWTGGAWGTDAGPVSIGAETNASAETPAANHFRGNIDEVRVYQQALSQAAVTAIATQTHACAITSSINHFSIDIGGATASTCTPKNITITALNSLNNVVTDYSGTINITTSPAHGDWAKVTAAGTLTLGAADSGTASYQFVVADGGVAVLALSNDHADAALTVSVVDSLVPTSSTTSAPISFGDNAFVLTNDSVQVAGRPQAMSVAMWRKAPGSGVCSISNRYTGARTLKAWYTRDADDPGGTAPGITGMTSPPLGSAVPGGNNLTLTFAAGSANFNLSTADVGKYAINLRDDSGTFGGAIIDGSSNTITTRPFALVVSAIRQGATNNPANTGPAGAVFARAGTNFQATVGAYRWNSAADANVALGDGIPDAGATLAQLTANGAAPSYTWPTTVAGGAPYTPAGGTLIPWSNVQTGACPAAAPNCFASGIATPTNLGYDEVGSFTLSVAATGFLNTAGVDLTAANGTALVFDNTPARNGVVGRFIPDHFDTVVTAQGSPVGFAYSGNPVGPVPGQPFTVTVTAKNALATPTVTSNYAASTGFSKDVNLSAPVGDGQLYVDAVAGGAGAVPAGNFLLGVGKSDQSVPADKKISFVFTSLPSAEQAIQIHAEDADTVTSSGANGNINIRHGRLRVFNAFGSEKAALSLPLRAEYWSGNSWLINADDNFSVIPNTSVALSVVSPATLGTSAAGTTLVGGQGSIVLAIPTPGATGNTGSVDLAINLGTGAADQSCLFVHPATTGAAIPWLRSINGNCAATYDRDPAARGSFGIYAPETRKTIHVRELF